MGWGSPEVMKRYFFILIISVISFSLTILIFQRSEPEPEIRSKKEYSDFHYASYADKSFYPNLVGNIFLVNQEKVYGGIVSHHFYAEKYISDFFSSLKSQNPSVIVIIGPNHFNAGSRDILVSQYPYKTPWGILEPDNIIIDHLMKEGGVAVEEIPFEREHAIGTLVGFAKYIFPDAKIVPIILKRSTNVDKIDQLAEELNKILPEKSLVLASVDFSHHLNRFAANLHDDKSISAIGGFNISDLSKLEIDSPLSVRSLLKYLSLRGAMKMSHFSAKSTDISKVLDSEDVTSYLFASFTRGEAAKEQTVSVLNFGDVMLGRSVKKAIDKGLDPFEKIISPEGNFFKGYDFISINLEGPVTEIEKCPPKEISFKFDPKDLKLLSTRNINIANIANNHIYDCATQGVWDTKKYLDEYRIDSFGSSLLGSQYIIKETAGKKVAFMGLSMFGQAEKNLKEIYNILKQLKQENDLVVINIHWGVEYNKLPTQDQQSIARNLIDSGADVIIGHHPHVVQSMEVYKNKPIFYSLGNFVFDQPWPDTKDGIGVGLAMDSKKFKVYIFPYHIDNYQPKLLFYGDAIKFCNTFLKDISSRDDCQFEILQN